MGAAVTQFGAAGTHTGAAGTQLEAAGTAFRLTLTTDQYTSIPTFPCPSIITNLRSSDQHYFFPLHLLEALVLVPSVAQLLSFGIQYLVNPFLANHAWTHLHYLKLNTD